MTRPRYKMTEIGEIPEEWVLVEMGDNKVSEIVMGQSPPSSFYNTSGEGMPFLQGNADFGEIYPQPRIFCNKPLKVAEKGDILLSVRAPVGELNISAFKCVIGRGLAAIKCKDRKTHYKYLYYYLKYAANRLRALSTGSTFKAVGKDILSHFEIGLPDFEEQKKIAEILSSMDEAIQRINDQITKTERLKKGLMQTLLTKGIGHTKFKIIKIREIPDNWNVEALGSMIEIMDSRRVPLSETQRENKKGTIPYCGANGVIDYIDDYIFEEEAVLLAEDGGNYGKYQNKAYIMAGKYWVNNHAHIFRGRYELLENKFIMQWLNFAEISPYVSGTTRTKLNQEMLKSILVPIPPPSEQQKIAEILSETDLYMGGLENYKIKLNILKKGLMQDLLTGKVRVNNLKGVLNINGNTV